MAQRNSMGDERGDPGESPVRHFVNHLNIWLSMSEVQLDLASVGHRGVDCPPLWRFVTTPDHLDIMHQDLGAAIDQYKARFGGIKTARTALPSITVVEGGDNG